MFNRKATIALFSILLCAVLALGISQDYESLLISNAPFYSVDHPSFDQDHDGVCDTEDIQAAIDYAESQGGGVVCFPCGTYLLSATITVESEDITLQGNGRGCTVLEGTHSSGAVVEIGEGKSRIKDLTIDASAARQSGGAGSNYGLLIEPDDEATGRCWHNIVEFIEVKNQPSHGIVSSGGVYGTTYLNVNAETNDGHGLVIDNGSITSRTNTVQPGLATIIDAELTQNGGNGLVIGNDSDATDNRGTRVTIINADIGRNAESAGTRIEATQAYIYGSEITIQDSAFNGLNIAGDTDATTGLHVSGKNIDVINNRFLNVLTNAVVIDNHAEYSTQGIVVRGFHITGDEQEDLDPAVNVSASAQDVEIFTAETNNIISLYDRELVNRIQSRVTIIRKNEAEVVNNSTTLQDDDELYYPMLAKQKINFRFIIFYDGGATSDIKFNITMPGGGGAMRWCTPSGTRVHTDDSIVQMDAETQDSTSVSLGVDATADRIVIFEGTARTDGTAGNLQLQWAQNSAVAENTRVLRESYLMVW